MLPQATSPLSEDKHGYYRATSGTHIYGAVKAPSQPQYRRTRPAGRLRKALSVLLWVVLSIVTGSLLQYRHWRCKHGRYIHQSGPPSVEFPSSLKSECSLSWDELPRHNPWAFPRKASQKVDLPHTVPHLLFLSRNAPKGTVIFKSSDGPSDGIRVNVTVSYRWGSLQDQVHVCVINRTDGALGVGIFGPTRGPSLPFDNQLSLTTTVTLPSSLKGGSRLVNRLEIDMPSTSLRFEEFPDDVHFGEVSLTSAGMGVNATNLVAESIFVTTSNEPIVGSFNVSSSLALITSNASIEVDVGLVNDDKRTTSVFMKTSNGDIHASTYLLRDNEASAGGKYDVTALTSNKGVFLTFPTSPVDSRLVVTGKTSNAEAVVSLHPAYEGTFQLQAFNHTPRVETADVDDPSGRGRKRDVQVKFVLPSSLTGEVAWGGSPSKGRGNVNILSSNAEVLLNV